MIVGTENFFKNCYILLNDNPIYIVFILWESKFSDQEYNSVIYISLLREKENLPVYSKIMSILFTRIINATYFDDFCIAISIKLK